MSIDLENWERNGTERNKRKNLRRFDSWDSATQIEIRNRNMSGGKNTVFYFLSFVLVFFAPHHNPLFVRSRTTVLQCTLYIVHHIIEHTHRPCTLILEYSNINTVEKFLSSTLIRFRFPTSVPYSRGHGSLLYTEFS